MQRLIAFMILTLAGCTSDSEDSTPADAAVDASFASDAGPPGKTLVLGAIYTVAEPPWAEAMLIDEEGVIEAIGARSEVEPQAAGATVWTLEEGEIVLPGFHDIHLHAVEAGINETICIVDPGQSAAAYEAQVAACANEQAGDSWVRAAGMSATVLEGGESPVDMLDRAVPDRPVIVLDDLGHSMYANHRAIEAVGVTEEDPDPQGGVYLRDAEGRLTGAFLESAQQRFRDAAAVDPEVIDRGLRASMKELARQGITTISDAGGYWTRGGPDGWVRLRDEGALTVRAHNALYLFPDRPAEEQIAAIKARFSDEPGALLRFNTIKIYMDGILSLGTATLLEPYDDSPQPDLPTGFPYFEAAALERYTRAFAEHGFGLHFHAVGDRAVREALDLIEALGETARRHRTSHNYLVHPDDLSRFAELDVTADFQISEFAVTPDFVPSYAYAVGDRADRILPVHDLLEAEARVTLSSDWDADALPPFGIIARSMTRPQQSVPEVATAIRLLTINAAEALGAEDVTGSLEVGKAADFVIADQNVLELEPESIAATKVLATVLGGRIVFEAR